MRDPDEARRSRKIRDQIYEGGSYPKGERAINPTKARTAAQYHEWMQGASNLSGDSGSFLANLEGEERATGEISYPEGHPRRAQVEAGHLYPSGESLPSQRTSTRGASGVAEGFEGDNGVPLARSATPRPAQSTTPALRPNRFHQRCVNCGEDVAPGEGVMERHETGWKGAHHPRCP